ncbi:molybdopterin-dependent oxidoreductase [Halomonas sp. QX-2]|uniref:Molybdopterin-dependent oxidoreductase n=1 Tax=Vreelandella sedimenti TaxID=2729618 RepID=A0A7Z0N462_9GAMM|nr:MULTISPECIES: molybdopterin-binding protein [Halomonas]NYT70879.1 molybdopterin-dependent oxidoreductase [Halomonas sedimenti]
MTDSNTRLSTSPEPDRARRRLLGGLCALGAGTFLTGCDRLSESAPVRATLSNVEQLSYKAQRLIASRQALAKEFDESQIAPVFRPNGTTNPQEDYYRAWVENGFADWRLTIDGLVEEPMTLSLPALREMASRTQITRHDCVEGWSCIGQWTGVPLADLLDRVRPADTARFVVFHCADHTYGGSDLYYESLDMIEAYHPQTLLAYDLNGEPLPVANGAPIRLRAERQLGYKQAKYVMRVELVESFKQLHGGKGGYWEDRGYDWWAGI